MQGEPNNRARDDLVEIWRDAQGRRNEDLRAWLRRQRRPHRSIRNPGFAGSAKSPHAEQEFPDENAVSKMRTRFE
jgi:hypothetical protein